MTGLYAYLLVLLGGNVGLGLTGVAVHHGYLGAQTAFTIAVLNGALRMWLPERRQWKARQSIHPKGTRRRLLRTFLRITGRGLFIMALGFGWAHVLHPLPQLVRLGTAALLAACLVVFTFERVVLIARSLPEWPLLRTTKPPPSLAHFLWVTLVPFWPAPSATLDDVFAEPFDQISFAADTVRWLDPPYRGVRTAFTTARALVLGKPAGAPNDVYVVHVKFSHDGRVARISDIYNLSDTAAVDEGNIVTWRKWAAWTVLDGSPSDGAPATAPGPTSLSRSIEIADLRGEPSGVGLEWTWLTRTQRALANWQQVGQFRGVGRSQLAFDVPAAVSHLNLDENGLTATLTPTNGAAFPIALDLGKAPATETLGTLLTYRSNETPLPPELVPWMVDRMRAVPWIGSDGMQWIKGWAFRASEQLEDLEHTVVGIDADEEIAAQLGASIEALPLATAGPVPGWPPSPMEPVLRERLTAEGQWVSLATDLIAGTAPDTPSPFVFSFVRSDPERAYVQTSVVMWDPRRIELHMVAGTEEPKSATGEMGSGQIPRVPEVLGRVVAAFNGAFQAVHGDFGMMENRRIQLPPKPYAATVATYPDGNAGFGTWPASEGIPVIPADMDGYRQNLTPLIVDGKYNPYQREWWGGVPEGWTEETRTVRSGLCLTVEGYMGYFYSLGITPEALGRAMKSARCSYGIHLDMNAGHAGFEFYHVAAAGKLPDLGRPLDAMWESKGQVHGLPGYEFLSRLLIRKMPLMGFPRYLNLNTRDFFYLTQRALLPGNDLAPFDPSFAEDGKWQVVNTGVTTWPPAATVTTLHVPDPKVMPGTGVAPTAPAAAFTVTRLDAKQLRVVSTPGAAHLGLIATRPGAPLPFSFAAIGKVAATTPSPTPTAAGCIDADGMLVLFEPPNGVVPDATTLQNLFFRLRCVTALAETGGVRLTKPQPGVVSPDGTPADAAASPSMLWLAHVPLTGAKRIFEDTPVLHPKQWAILQRKPVPFGQGATQAPPAPHVSSPHATTPVPHPATPSAEPPTPQGVLSQPTSVPSTPDTPSASSSAPANGNAANRNEAKAPKRRAKPSKSPAVPEPGAPAVVVSPQSVPAPAPVPAAPAAP